MADVVTVKQEVEEPEANLETSPAQAAGRRTRKPVQPLGSVVTRRTSARQVASSVTRASAESPRQTRGRQAALRRQASPTPAAEASPTEAVSQHRKGWKRKKSDAEDLSTSEPEIEHDDSDSDPVWMPDANKATQPGAAATSLGAATSNTDGKPARRAKGAKPAKIKPARPGARKGSAKKPNGGKADTTSGGSRRSIKVEPAIDLAPDDGAVSPESLQLKVVMPPEIGETVGMVKRDYTRRPSATRFKKPKPEPVAAPTEVKVEGNFKTGDYIMAVADKNKVKPPVWRIEGRSLLQRFEAIESGDRLLYRNISSFSAWNPLEQAKYVNITVRVHSNSRSATVVEVLDVHGNTAAGGSNENNGTEARSTRRTVQDILEKYEVYLQTLLSHVLDPNFLSEVHKENDEYFLSNLQTIDSENEARCEALKDARNWGAELWKAATSFPEVAITNAEDTSSSCEGCGLGPVTRLADFSGSFYDKLDLKEIPADADVVDKHVFRLCYGCAQPLRCYSQLHHYKLHTFLKCKNKVLDMRTEENVRESHIILERCLQDDEWVNEMFSELQTLWLMCSTDSS